MACGAAPEPPGIVIVLTVGSVAVAPFPVSVVTVHVVAPPVQKPAPKSWVPAGVTVVSSVSSLFELFGSDSFAVTVAVSEIVVPDDVVGAWTRTVIAGAVAPLANDVARVQCAELDVTVHNQSIPDAPMTVPPCWISVTEIPVAASGPPFETNRR
jgi:hypothetical protein